MALHTATASSLTLEEKSWESALLLVKSLIRLQPTYASKGLEEAQELIFHHLKNNGFDQVFECFYSSKDIENDEEYVDVPSFGELYKNYQHIPKRNVIGIIEGNSPGKTLLLNGHIDVDLCSTPLNAHNEKEYKLAKVEKGQLFGRGSTDMLFGLVSLITVASLLSQNKHLWKGRIILTSVVDEEIGGNGTLHALKWLKNNHYLNSNTECLIAEPSDRTVCLESLGFLHVILSFHRSPIHMGVATRVNNALYDLEPLLASFQNILEEAAKNIDQSVVPETLIYNFGIISGGQDPAIPISTIRLEGTIFFPENLSAEDFFHEIKKIVLEKGLSIQLSCSEFSFKGAKFPAKDLFKALATFPFKPGLFKSPCDARLFKKHNIPTVIFGPGFLKEAHCADEYINLNEVRSYLNHILKSFLTYFND